MISFVTYLNRHSLVHLWILPSGLIVNDFGLSTVYTLRGHRLSFLIIYLFIIPNPFPSINGIYQMNFFLVLPNSVDPDEMPHDYVVFHLSLELTQMIIGT